MEQALRTFLLVDPLKTSSLDSVTAYIKPQLQINVTFNELDTKSQNFINLLFLKLSPFWNPLKHEIPFNLACIHNENSTVFDLSTSL